MSVSTEAKTILVVEDNIPINKLFCKNLTASHFHPHGVFTIQDALDYINIQLPQIIVLDLELPDGYGTQILDDLLKKQIQIPTMIVSANSFALHLQPIYSMVKHVLVKPVSPRLMVSLINDMLVQS
jgi:DNA-binding response OmpR family regulator